MRARYLWLLGAFIFISACGPSAEQQAAMDAAQRSADQDKCAGFGFAAGTNAFAQCMMKVSSQREAQAAADRRAAADRDAANQRAQAAAQAAKDKADQDAWDRKTGQGKYSSSSFGSSSASSSFSSPSPTDPVHDAIDKDMQKIEGSQ